MISPPRKQEALCGFFLRAKEQNVFCGPIIGKRLPRKRIQRVWAHHWQEREVGEY